MIHTNYTGTFKLHDWSLEFRQIGGHVIYDIELDNNIRTNGVAYDIPSQEYAEYLAEDLIERVIIDRILFEDLANPLKSPLSDVF